MGLIKEFRDFAMKGNVIDLAVAVIIGGAFGKIVTSMVNDILMPPLGKVLNNVNFSDLFINLTPDKGTFASIEAAKAAGAATINYGSFINEVINFLIVAVCIFAVIKAMSVAKSRFEKKEAAAPPPPPAPDIVLLTEIRDLLKKQA
ncbi:MAG: large conductance mechanosensitive channel protein MscL [Phycisphaeraceae bacterium]|nr:large conductance mechanosensitive channel protein MscL [Phycisphaeraceae bacterium]